MALYLRMERMVGLGQLVWLAAMAQLVVLGLVWLGRPMVGRPGLRMGRTRMETRTLDSRKCRTRSRGGLDGLWRTQGQRPGHGLKRTFRHFGTLGRDFWIFRTQGYGLTRHFWRIRQLPHVTFLRQFLAFFRELLTQRQIVHTQPQHVGTQPKLLTLLALFQQREKHTLIQPALAQQQFSQRQRIQ